MARQFVYFMQGLTKSYPTRKVLDNIHLSFYPDAKIGVLGVNGSGKSTLLKIMAGLDKEYAGEAWVAEGARVGYLEQEPQLDPKLSVRENVMQGVAKQKAILDRYNELAANYSDETADEMTKLQDEIEAQGLWDLDSKVDQAMDALRCPPDDADVTMLSGGERRRVALCRLLLDQPDLLLLDEPTNHLDAESVSWLEGHLRNYPGAILIVTHDRYFLDRVATRILEIDRGTVHAYEGGYTRFLELQAERIAVENERERARAAFVRRELDWIRRGPQARSTKQKARIDRFDAAVAARPVGDEVRKGPLALRLPTGGRLGKTILELRGVGKSIAGRTLINDLTLLMKPGDRIGIVGPNGAGKTTLVRMVLGELAPDAGEIKKGVNTKIAALDQMRAQLRDDRTVLEEVAGDGDMVHLEDGPVHVRTFLRMMLFDDRFADTPVGTLSGGERNRVQLAKLLREGGNLLVLDEPTNDLDLVTLGVVEEALASFPGCALVVSHDRWFLDRVATGILAFEGDGNVTLYEGDYTSYLARRKVAEKPVVPVEKTPIAAPVKAAPAKKKLSFKDKQELASMESTILEAEQKVADLEKTLADPDVYKSRATEVPALVAALDAARAEVDRLYTRWQALSE